MRDRPDWISSEDPLYVGRTRQRYECTTSPGRIITFPATDGWPKERRAHARYKRQARAKRFYQDRIPKDH